MNRIIHQDVIASLIVFGGAGSVTSFETERTTQVGRQIQLLTRYFLDLWAWCFLSEEDFYSNPKLTWHPWIWTTPTEIPLCWLTSHLLLWIEHFVPFWKKGLLIFNKIFSKMKNNSYKCRKFLPSRTNGLLPSFFFEKLSFNKLDSIDWHNCFQMMRVGHFLICHLRPIRWRGQIAYSWVDTNAVSKMSAYMARTRTRTTGSFLQIIEHC